MGLSLIFILVLTRLISPLAPSVEIFYKFLTPCGTFIDPRASKRWRCILFCINIDTKFLTHRKNEIHLDSNLRLSLNRGYLYTYLLHVGRRIKLQQHKKHNFLISLFSSTQRIIFISRCGGPSIKLINVSTCPLTSVYSRCVRV